MWIYRLGMAKAKEHALTGRPLTGRQAADCGLINTAVPFASLEATVAELAADLARIPASQLAAMKLVVNQAYENMGLTATQTLGPILDGLMRNTPEALAFVERADTDGVGAAVEERDGPFGDYSQAPDGMRPRPGERDPWLSAPRPSTGSRWRTTAPAPGRRWCCCTAGRARAPTTRRWCRCSAARTCWCPTCAASASPTSTSSIRPRATRPPPRPAACSACSTSSASGPRSSRATTSAAGSPRRSPAPRRIACERS